MKFLIGSRIVAVLFVCAWFSTAMAQVPASFLRGGDVSEIPEVEAAGGHYSYHGKEMDPFVMMKQAGWNFVRFRIWNDPKGGWCDKAHTLAMAKRAAAQGINISLDFHYSDWWADPGKQFKPAAWKDLPFDKLVQATYDYTKDVVSAMIAQGTPPYMVQVGNEITGGMLWPDGKVSGNEPATWKPLITLLKAGFQAVHDAEINLKGTLEQEVTLIQQSPMPAAEKQRVIDKIRSKYPSHILTMIHLDRGGDNKGATWWFDNALKGGLQFDAIGLSYYPVWHGSLESMQANVNDLATRYHKDIYIVETGYPWAVDARSKSSEHVEGDAHGLLVGYPPTPEGQNNFLAKVIEIIRNIPDGRGKGLLYWAPTWISPKKKATPYDNLALFNYDGDSLPSFDTMGGHEPTK